MDKLLNLIIMTVDSYTVQRRTCGVGQLQEFHLQTESSLAYLTQAHNTDNSPHIPTYPQQSSVTL